MKQAIKVVRILIPITSMLDLFKVVKKIKSFKNDNIK